VISAGDFSVIIRLYLQR